MNTWIILLGIIIFLLTGGYVFLYFFQRKLHLLENTIISIFQTRSDILPGIYEISKEYLTKHNDIFRESLTLRKTEFSMIENGVWLNEIIELESHIHHEINFIFKVCNKHPKLLKNGNFIYIRETIIQRSHKLWEMIQLYKTMTEKYNFLIHIKNYSLIGLLLPFSKKINI